MSKKVLITGASGGFGQLIVADLLKAGYEVAGSMRAVEGRNKDVAAKLTQEGAKVVEMDVTNDQSVNDGVAKAIELLGGLDIVINNAGIGVSGMIEHFTPEDFKKVFEVNVFGVQRVNRAVLPHLRKQGSGTLVFISSLLGRVTIPFYGPYNSSKWALEGMAENYRTELSGFGVETCLVEPGGYATSFMESLIYPSDTSRNESYGEFMGAPQAMGEGFGEAMANNPEQKPEKVAEAVTALLSKPIGQKPFRTTVDTMGMKEGVDKANELQEQITKGLYGSFGIGGMLDVKVAEEAK